MSKQDKKETTGKEKYSTVQLRRPLKHLIKSLTSPKRVSREILPKQRVRFQDTLNR
jgi:hypothetical protein